MATQGSPLSIFEDVPRTRDRRRTVRQKVHSPAYASFDGIGGGMVLDLTEITDISEAGMSLHTASVLTANRTLNLVLDLSETKTYINTTGYVVWTDSSGHAGIRFSKMPDATRQQLKQWLFFNLMTAAAKARETKGGRGGDTPEILVPSPRQASLLDNDALSALLKPVLRGEASVAVADAPTLSAIQEEVDSVGSDSLAALQLLADRAQSMVRAAGAAIALSEGADMVCRASSGEAPPVTARFQVGAGFSGECVRTAKLQRCDDSEIHPIVDRESCRQLGIRSMIAVPIVLAGKVLGLLEVFSPQPFAFGESDAATLRRISDIVARVAEKQQQKLQVLAELATSSHADDLRFEQPRTRLLKRRSIVISAAIVAALILITALLYWFLHRPSTNVSPPTAAPAVQVPAPSSAAETTTFDSLRKYATQGDPVAQFTLGAHYAQGDGVKQDYAEAVRWFTKAAQQGHVVAQATLGAYYWAGRGVQQDLSKAYFWSVLARAGGDEASKYRVAALTSRMTRAQVAAAQQQAEEWLRAHQTSRAAR